jgi:hypothetical protein
MMNYPSQLPCVSRIEGHSATLSSGVVRTPMEAGNTRQRRMQRVLPHQIALVFVMSQEVYGDWLAWVNAYAFDGFFALQLPGLLASRADADTVGVPVRFMSDISAELIPANRLWYWRCRVSAEWLPMAADLAVLPFGDWAVSGGAIPDWIVGGTPPAPSMPDTFTAGTATTPSGIAG